MSPINSRFFEQDLVLWNPTDEDSEVHELTCRWLNGENQDPQFVAKYVEIPRRAVPAGRKFARSCCAASRF